MEFHLLFAALVFTALAVTGVFSVTVDDEAAEFLKKLLEEFEKNPDDMKFSSIIQSSGDMGLKIPKVFIWCPLRHFKLKSLLCPVHNKPLKISDWVDHREPMLVYDIASNILLIQCSYSCDLNLPDCDESGHKYLSASPEIMAILPGVIHNMFPLKTHYQTALSTQMLDFLIVELDQGNTFDDVCLSLSSLNIREFTQQCRLEQAGSNFSVMSTLEIYRDSPMYALPSEEDLIQVFLAYVNDISMLLQGEMNKKVGKILTCDNTFKLTSKNQGEEVQDGEGSQCEGIFLATNERKEIVFWRMVNLLSFNDMQEVLIEYSERLRKHGETLQMVIVDDCCQVRTMYEEIFGSKVNVKLNLLQASQHVVSKLSKGVSYSQQIISDFALVFRATGDTAEERLQTTPSIEEMSANLEIFLGRWRRFLAAETIEAVQIVQGHIANGCLSGIPAGCGTENNENLQEYLKKHIISSFTSSSAELTAAVLAFALYAWNCHKKHSKMLKSSIISKIRPSIPVELLNMVVPSPLIVKASGIKMSIVEILQSWMETERSVEISDCKTESSVRFMVMRVLDLHEFMVQMRKKSHDQGVNFLKFLFLDKLFSQLRTKLVEGEDGSLTQLNQTTLKRNLKTYGLVVEKTIGDGNCCFRSIVTQVKKITNATENSAYAEFVKSLGLCSTIDDDAQCLRALFVKEISSNMEKYQRWISLSEERLNEELAKFTEVGFYEGDLGDFCVKVCSDILQIPIVVVTSYDKASQVPFVPETVTFREPIILAFDHTAPGHYDATTEANPVQTTPPETEELKKRLRCSCGRRSKDATGPFCRNDVGEGKSAKCACVKAGKTCTKYCTCHHCDNDKRTTLTDEDIILNRVTNGKRKKPCRCGKKGVPGACRDSEIRRCKCPCFRSGLGCIPECGCSGCANIYNDETKDAVNVIAEEVTEKKKTRKRKSEVTAEELGDNIDSLLGTPLNENNQKPKEEVCHWTDLETLGVLVAVEILEFVKLPVTSSHCHELYSHLISSLLVTEMQLQFGQKTIEQVELKMRELDDMRNTLVPGSGTMQRTVAEKRSDQVDAVITVVVEEKDGDVPMSGSLPFAEKTVVEEADTDMTKPGETLVEAIVTLVEDVADAPVTATSQLSEQTEEQSDTNMTDIGEAQVVVTLVKDTPDGQQVTGTSQIAEQIEGQADTNMTDIEQAEVIVTFVEGVPGGQQVTVISQIAEQTVEQVDSDMTVVGGTQDAFKSAPLTETAVEQIATNTTGIEETGDVIISGLVQLPGNSLEQVDQEMTGVEETESILILSV